MNIEELKSNGVAYIDNLISNPEIDLFKKIMTNNNALGKDNISGFFPSTYRSLIKNILNLNFIKAYHGLILINFAKKNKFKKIADEYFGAEAKLVKIDSYISEISDKKIIDWHTDQAYSGAKKVNPKDFINPNQVFLKFFLFLTDVNKDNGDLAYIKSSHKVSFHIRELIYNGLIKYEPHWTVKQIFSLSKKKKVKELLLKNTSLKLSDYNNFITNASFIEKSNDTKEFDRYTNAGDLMVFDEHGVHRASAPKTNTRYVMRFMYCMNDFY